MANSNLFHPIESSRLSDEAVQQIKTLIEDGVFKPNDKLPSERQLGQELSVSRASVREALRVLEAMGFIDVQPGVGAYVLDRRLGSDLSSRWMEWMSEHHQKVDELLEIREALEPKAVALAAERMTEENMEMIMNALARMEESAEQGEIDAAVEADVEFHDLITRATQNELLIKLNDSINHVLLESRYAYFQDPQRVAGSCEQHRRIVEALQERDAQRSVDAMLAHVKRTRESMRQLVEASEEAAN